MFKISKDNKIIFNPGRWVSKKCVIVPDDKAKKKIIWSNRAIMFLNVLSLVIGGILNSWLIIVGLIILFSLIDIMWLKKIVAEFEVTDETITFKDSTSEYSEKTRSFDLWLVAIVSVLMVIYLAWEVYVGTTDVYSNFAGIVLFSVLFVFVLYAIKLKKHNKAVK